MTDAEGRTPLQLATDPVIRRLIQQEEVVRISGDKFDLLEAVEVNDTSVSMRSLFLSLPTIFGHRIFSKSSVLCLS